MSGRLILVIDDDPAQLRLMQRLLGGAGFEVQSAPDGEAGLVAARARPPDLIILDVMMPRLNGFQTLRALKADATTAATPVVILTSKQEAAAEAWATQTGAAAYLTKPVDFPALMGTLRRLLGPA